MAANPSINFASASLYVGDLNNDVNETTLFEIFSQLGPVASIRVCRDAVSRRSLGYAYVNFHSVNDAERALDTLNYTMIKNRPCRIMWSQRDPSQRKSGVGNVFIKNLDKSVDLKELSDAFSQFGNILSAKIALDKSTGESLGYGFVNFDSDESANEAIQKVNGTELKGKVIIVASFVPKDKRPKDRNKFTNVYIKNLPDNCTKDKLEAIFSQFGTITNSACMFNEKEARHFGFVNFETVEQAQQAIDKGHEMEVEGRQLYVCRAQKKSEREHELSSRYKAIIQEKRSQFKGLNLYVKNLPDEMTEDELLAEFAKFGAISSHKIMQDEVTLRSRGFGFVCFVESENAQRAVLELHGKMLSNKPLYVALAMRKEARLAQVEQMRAKGMMSQGMFQGGQPMFYGPPGSMPNRGGFPMNPYMMPPMAGRGGFPPGGRPPYMGMPPANMRGQMPPQGYTLVPAQQMGMGPGGRPQNQGPRMPRPQGPQGPMGPAGAPRQPLQQGGMPGQPMQARNPAARPGQPAAGGRYPGGRAAKQEGGSAVLPGGSQPLTIQQLLAATPEMQKQMIGERLFPLISNKQPELAGKITGMLLEMENPELLELLDSEEALDAKIQEALRVLREAQEGQ